MVMVSAYIIRISLSIQLNIYICIYKNLSLHSAEHIIYIPYHTPGYTLICVVVQLQIQIIGNKLILEVAVVYNEIDQL